MKTDWNIESALEQLRACNFICEGGPLENNITFSWIVAKLTEQEAEYASVVNQFHDALRHNTEQEAELQKLRAVADAALPAVQSREMLFAHEVKRLEEALQAAGYGGEG